MLRHIQKIRNIYCINFGKQGDLELTEDRQTTHISKGLRATNGTNKQKGAMFGPT